MCVHHSLASDDFRLAHLNELGLDGLDLEIVSYTHVALIILEVDADIWRVGDQSLVDVGCRFERRLTANTITYVYQRP